MYITYIDQDKMQKVTCSTNIITERNIAYAERENGSLISLAEEARELLKKGVNSKYTTYYKKKSNGQKRQINVPDDELKAFMRKVVKTFTAMSGFMWPDNMYAYIEGRGIKQHAELHKNAAVIIRMDIKSFFDNCTFKFVTESMKEVYPFCLMDWNLLEPIVKACMLKGRLAQGAPTSAILSNIAMIPFVTHANNWTKAKTITLGLAPRGKYFKMTKGTRRKATSIVAKRIIFSMYADDIIISTNIKAPFGENAWKTIRIIQKLLNWYTPLQVNPRKTKYVDIRRKGGAWVTGLMVNKEHNVTVGREKKEKLKATIFSFLADCKNGKPWDEHRVRQMMGTVSYIRHIEPEFVDMIIQKYNQKLNIDYHEQIKNIIYS
ncbi:MAG: hypothetical protein IJE68_04185 [Clostridia bacterium]|nr:hypothetical protein [Clostridia bacterium]